MSPLNTPTWTVEMANQIEFARALNEAGWFENPRETIDFFEKPWKWDPEWQLWESCGKPHEDDDDEGAWGWFLRKLEQHE